MSTVVLFHHVLGLTPGIEAFADTLRGVGHTVRTPDLFAGRTFPELSAGLAYVEQLGEDELGRRAAAACADLPPNVVYAGFSLGASVAQQLLQSRPGAAGAIFLHAFVDPELLPGTWPINCPVEVYAAEHDPFFVGDGDYQAAQACQERYGNLRLHLYPGRGHLVCEPASPDYDPAVADLLAQDVLVALASMDQA